MSNQQPVQFDLNNPQHLAMRKLMADIYAWHCAAAESNESTFMKRYEGMAIGLEKVAMYLLADPALLHLCFELSSALYYQQECILEVAA
jgi:hypothetical protein